MILERLRYKYKDLLNDIQKSEPDPFQWILFKSLAETLKFDVVDSGSALSIIKGLLKIIAVEERKTGLVVRGSDKFYLKINYEPNLDVIYDNMDGWVEIYDKGHDSIIKASILAHLYVLVFTLALSLEIFDELVDNTQTIELW